MARSRAQLVARPVLPWLDDRPRAADDGGFGAGYGASAAKIGRLWREAFKFSRPGSA